MEISTLVDILIIEDNPRDAEMITMAIKKQGIVNPLHVVVDGAEALDFIFCQGEYADQNILLQPKVIFLDLKLPKVSGLEVLRALKVDERTRNIPVVIVTSSQEDPDIKAAYEFGANSYVVKPVSAVDFVYAISKIGLSWLLVNRPLQ